MLVAIGGSSKKKTLGSQKWELGTGAKPQHPGVGTEAMQGHPKASCPARVTPSLLQPFPARPGAGTSSQHPLNTEFAPQAALPAPPGCAQGQFQPDSMPINLFPPGDTESDSTPGAPGKPSPRSQVWGSTSAPDPPKSGLGRAQTRLNSSPSLAPGEELILQPHRAGSSRDCISSLIYLSQLFLKAKQMENEFLLKFCQSWGRAQGKTKLLQGTGVGKTTPAAPAWAFRENPGGQILSRRWQNARQKVTVAPSED